MFASIKRLAASLLAIAAVSAPAQTLTNSVTFNFQDVLQGPWKNRSVSIESISTPRTNPPYVAVNFYLQTNSGTAGAFTLSNLLDGTYRITAQSLPRPTTFLIYVPTNNPGTHYISDLLTTNIVDSANTAYTKAQADGRFVKIIDGVATNLVVSNLNKNLGNTAVGTYLRRGTNGLPYWDTVTASGGAGSDAVLSNAFIAGSNLFQTAILSNAAFVAFASNFAVGFSNGLRITPGVNVSSIQTNRTAGTLEFVINTTDTGTGSGELWVTNASLLALSTSNGLYLTNLVGLEQATNIVYVVNRPDWPHSGRGNIRNATNEVSFATAMDNGYLKANTVYSLVGGTRIFNFTNVNRLASNTIVELNGSILQLGTNATETGEGGKVYAFVSDPASYYSPGAQVRNGIIRLQGHLNANHTNAINGVGIWGNGTETIENVHVFDPKGNQASGSESFGLFTWPANNVANTPIIYAPRISRSSVTFTNGSVNQSYVTAISVQGGRETNGVIAQGWGLVDGCVVVGPGKGVGWSHGYSVFGRSRLVNSHAERLLRGVYHELQSGGNASTDNGGSAVINSSFASAENGIEITGYYTNSNFRFSGNVFSNFTRGIYISNTDASGTPGNAVGQIFDVAITENHFGQAGTNPHWNIYLRNVDGASIVANNTMHSTSNYFGTGSVTNRISTNIAEITKWANVLTNGNAATTNLVRGSTTIEGALNTGNYPLYARGTGSIISNALSIHINGNNGGELAFASGTEGVKLTHDAAGAIKNYLLFTDTHENLNEEMGLQFGNVDNTAPMFLRPANSNWMTLQSADGTGGTVLHVRGTILVNGTNIFGLGGGGGSVATDAIWDAAGDLAVGTGANTAARLAIGTASQVLTSDGTTAVWSNAPAGGTGGNVSATNNGASGEVAIYGGSAKMISFTNTLTGVTLQLTGISSNQIIATGQDLSFTNLTLNANQLAVNPSTASAGPSLYLPSGIRLTNAFFGNTNGGSSVPFTASGERLPALLHLVAPTNYTPQAVNANSISTNACILGAYHDRGGGNFGTNFYFDTGRDVSGNVVTNGGRLHLAPLVNQVGSIWLGPLSSTASFGLIGNNGGGSATPHVGGYFMASPSSIVGAQTVLTPSGFATDGTIWHGLGLRITGQNVQHVDSGFVTTSSNRITAAGGSWTNGAFIQMQQATVSNLNVQSALFAGFGATNIGGIARPALVTGQTNVLAYGGTTNTAGAATGDYLILYINGTRVKVAILAE